MCTFGTITRPENVAMCKILEIEVEAIDAAALDQFDRVAMVDVQPSFLEEEKHFGEVDLVIDHHPVEQPIRARIKDVRPSYGATSTILVEYLRAADVKITQRLATALLYGIKSDTLGLERGGTKADLEAFTYLYLLANHNALRRIERPELSPEALDVLARGLASGACQACSFTTGRAPRGSHSQLQLRRRPRGYSGPWSTGVDTRARLRRKWLRASAGDGTCAAFGELGMAGGTGPWPGVFPLRQLGRGAGEPAASGAARSASSNLRGGARRHRQSSEGSPYDRHLPGDACWGPGDDLPVQRGRRYLVPDMEVRACRWPSDPPPLLRAIVFAS